MSCVAAAACFDRDQLIVSHLPQVKLVAQSFHQRCPREVLLEDLVSAGTIGLIQAVDRFDPGRNLKLKTIAEHRIRGTMLDYLRQLDPLPRAVRQFARQRDDARRRMKERSGRAPSEDEIAVELGVPLAKYRRLILAIRASLTVSLDTVTKPDDQLPQVSALPTQGEDAESIHRMRMAIANLQGPEARVATALCEGHSLTQIASQLGVSESSVSLIKARAIQQLRVSLQITVFPREAGGRTCH